MFAQLSTSRTGGVSAAMIEPRAIAGRAILGLRWLLALLVIVLTVGGGLLCAAPAGAITSTRHTYDAAIYVYDAPAGLVSPYAEPNQLRVSPPGPSVATRGLSASARDDGVATKTGDEAFHYTSSKWIESITTNGLNKGAYATPNGSLSPLQASLELALPPNRALPDAVLRIDLAGLRKAGYDIPTPTRVSSTVSSGGRTYSMPGGGYEMQFPYAIPPEFIKVVPR